MYPFFQLILISASLTSTTSSNERTLFDFAQPQARNWRSVNDGVMGGRSTGQSRINSEKNLEFYGRLSLENNGGFASIRTSSNSMRMSAGDAIILRVKGDGRKYNLNLYANANLGGYSFRQSFQTKKGEWIEVKFPVDQFRATWRGRSYSRVKLDPNDVKGIGILLGDKKPGAFKLEVDWIKATSEVSGN